MSKRTRNASLTCLALALLGPAAMAQFGGTRVNPRNDGSASMKPLSLPCEAIDFESVPSGPTFETQQIGTQFSGYPYFVKFYYDGGALPRIAKTGSPRVAFAGPSGVDCGGATTSNDMPDPSQLVDFGCSFLTDDTALNASPPVLVIEYLNGLTTHQAGGRILDIDSPDQWTITAKGLNRSDLVPPQVVVLDSSTGGDGYGSLWYFDSPQSIHYIEIEYTGPPIQVGWGLDNFFPRCLPCDSQDSTIDFESLPDGSLLTETMDISDQWIGDPYYVRFELDDGNHTPPKLAQVGAPQRAFLGPAGSSCGASGMEDMPAAGTNFGCFFLTDDDSSTSTPIPLIIRYEVPVQRCSGYILDVDQIEAWTVTARDVNDVVLRTYQGNEVSQQIVSPPVLDGLGAYWSFDTTPIQQAIYSVRIEYTGPSWLSVGLAFDNFSFCREGPAPGPSVHHEPDSLQLGDRQLSLSQGGLVDLFLEAPMRLAGQPYFLVGALTHPSSLSCPMTRHTPMVLSRGLLDLEGRAAAQVGLPSQAAWLIGHDLECVYWVPDLAGRPRFASNPLSLRVLP